MYKIFTIVFCGVFCLFINISTIAQDNESDISTFQKKLKEIDKAEPQTETKDETKVSPEASEKSESVIEDENVHEEYEELGTIIEIGEPIEVSSNQTVSNIISIRGDVKVNGQVDGNIFVFVGNVDISENAIINKDLIIIIGSVSGVQSQIKGHVREINSVFDISAIIDLMMSGIPLTNFWAFIMLISTLLTHILIAVLLSENIENMSLFVNQRFIGSSVLGLIILIFTPIISILLFLSIVGIPLLVIFYSFLFITAILGKTSLFVSIGNAVIQKNTPNIIAVSLGYIVYRIATYIPYFGRITFLVAMIIGIGVCLRSFFGINTAVSRRTRKKVVM